MPRGSPFTDLCRATARSNRLIVADLHTHSTASDGTLTPSQIVVKAVNEKLHFLSLTDHDTFAGLAEAEQTLSQFTSTRLRLLPGVELSCTWNDREEHLLAYFPEGVTEEMLEEAVVRGLKRAKSDQVSISAFNGAHWGRMSQRLGVKMELCPYYQLVVEEDAGASPLGDFKWTEIIY